MPFTALPTRTATAILLAFASVGPALAADEHGSAGMPQFDVTRFPSQIFWLVVSFAVLYFLMAKLVLPRIGGIVESRDAKIQADLDAAQKANDAARAAAQEQEKALSTARGQASQLVREAAEAAAAQTSAKMHEIADRLAGEITAAERRIGEQRSQALTGLAGMSAEIASAVLTRLVGSADAGAVAQAVDQAAKAGSR